MNNDRDCEREYDFVLILSGISEFTQSIEDALFEAGLDDATLSIRCGIAYAHFSRSSASLRDAILSAIHDVRKANIGADVLRVDECELVTQADIARRIGRTRQLVSQYIIGKRGPGGFPAPAFQRTENAPFWNWCAVSHWLSQNDMIPPEQLYEAEVVAVINNALEQLHQRQRNPKLVEEVTRSVAGAAS